MVNQYNHIAKVLVKFEDIWFSTWKSQIESVKLGLKAPLLKRREDKQVVVNVEDR